MLPIKHARSERTTFLNQELMKLQFHEHDLKFRTSNGQFKYFVCSRCNLRVGIKCSSTDSCVSCRNSTLNQPCRTAEVVPVVATTTAEVVPVVATTTVAAVAVVQLCAVCRTSECIYACVPCMHKCACKSCASALRICPICRGQVNHWKQIFESGIPGSAEDIVEKEEIIGPVPFPPRASAHTTEPRDEYQLTSDSSSSDVEYFEPVILRYQQLPLHRVIRVQRPQPSDHEWATSDARRVYPESWCLAALAANGGDRATAFDLLQSNALLLRFRAFDHSCKTFIEMGFQERHAQICLLLNSGQESQALEELLRGNWANT
jgi:hypothetical protein